MQVLERKFSKEKTQKNFSAVAKFYDFWAKVTETKAIKMALDNLEPAVNGRILDIGVGTGEMFYKIISLNKGGHNIGLDISPGMLLKAKEKLTGNRNSGTAFILGDAFYLPFKNESFDYIFSSYVFDLFPENEFDNVIQGLFRMLKSNGKVVIITMSFGNRWYNKFWYLLAKYFPGLLTNCRPVDLESYFNRIFKNVNVVNISQNTFPSEILTAIKG
jgi:ubiquinone/menaquinone biosynthesis C-methylase UbiE